MEIGDIFVVNKADREGVNKTLSELRSMLQMSEQRYQAEGWMPPVVPTVAAHDQGVDELYRTILDHRNHLLEHANERLKKREEIRVKNQILDLLKERLIETALERLGGMHALDAVAEEIVARKKDPYRVSSELVEILLGGPPT